MQLRRRRLFLILFALALFLPLLGRRDIVTSHEARVAQTAREMAASGWPWSAKPVEVSPAELQRDDAGVMQVVTRFDLPPIRVNPWIIPLLGGELRLKKPPLPYWCAALLFKLAGGEREWLARLVPALLGAIATLLVADLARWTIGRRAATVAGLVWLSSYFVFEEYRKVMADPYLAFFTLLCAWAWVREARKGTPRIFRRTALPIPGGVGRNILGVPFPSILCFYLSLALGFLAKGPLLLVPLVVFIVAYHAFYRRPVPGRIGVHLLGLLLFAAITVPWPVAVWRAMPEAPRLWLYESAGGLTDTMENDREWYYYLQTFPQLPLPWTPALAVGLVLPFLRRRGREGVARCRSLQWVFPIVWLLADVLLFSISRQKKNAYLLPIAPAIVLAVTQVLVMIEARARLRRLAGWPGAVVSVQTAIAVGFAAVVIYQLRTSPLPMPMTRGLRWFYLLLPLPLVVLAIVPIWRTSRPQPWLRSTALAYAGAIFVFFTVPFTDQENARSPRRFAQAVGSILKAPGASVLPPVPPEAAYYLPLGLRYDPSAPEVFVVVDDRRHASAAGAPFFEKRIGRPVQSIERVIDGLPDDPRWHLFRVRVAPLVAKGFSRSAESPSVKADF